ncbi:FeoB-associated Cys-rich membrane protein (plasmid) [Pedobacter sp. BS3]|uniref:FeoB-associated Cys-rich membrane protein n=1 Tax=Pedobacter sp. BS3 TaxID=2567937 RepID=UPI0011EDB162|nr:FeoB-associated Cys-rich membrane protein [Pedobacter sp. BS3]TZF85923.1 FeoB-associated Cys-rich membrane protein [Pedobacter sp. BS3]
MTFQGILVALVFLLAAAYIGRSVYRNLHSKKGCSSGCGKCGVDFSEIKPGDTVKQK